MAELRPLDEKLAEVLGLAQAGKEATKKVEGLMEDDERKQLLRRMREEAEETARRCEGALDAFQGRKTAILEKARETRKEAVEMMKTYLGEDAEPLDGFEFLIMAEAGELGHLEVLRTLNERAREEAVQQLVEFAIPVQERHFSDVRETALALAGEEDPLEEG